MTSEIKLRMSSFKDSETKIYDDNISKYSKKAVDVHIVRGSISVRAKRFWRRLGNSKAQLLSKRNVSEFIY